MDLSIAKYDEEKIQKDSSEIKDAVATHYIGYEYRPNYDGRPHIPNVWSIMTAIKEEDNPESEWHLEIEGNGRHIAFFELGLGIGYDFQKRNYRIGSERYFNKINQRFKKDFSGLRKLVLGQLPGWFLRNPKSGKLIKKLITLSIPIISEASSRHIAIAKFLPVLDEYENQTKKEKKYGQEKYQPRIGSDIKDAINDAIVLAKKSGRTIGFEFNGVYLVATEKSNSPEMFKSYCSKYEKLEKKHKEIAEIKKRL